MFLCVVCVCVSCNFLLIFFYSGLFAVLGCLFSKMREEKEKARQWVGGKEGGVRRKKTIIRMYCRKKRFSIKTMLSDIVYVNIPPK